MVKTHRTSRITSIVSVIAALLFLASCGNAARGNPIAKTEFLLDTVCTVTVFSAKDEVYASEALALCADYEKRLSRTVADSEVSTVNAAQGAETPVSPELMKLMEKAIYYGELSEGRFDVTIGGVSSLWDFSSLWVFSSVSEERTVPSAVAVEAALPSVDYRNIELSADSVRLKDPATRLDLGGIAKGFIADKMAEYLREQGVDAVLIDLGGNVVTVGSKAEGIPWKVGVRNPFPPDADSEAQSILGTIEIEGAMSVGTSGTYERYFMRDGVRYHHILDPKTGFPAETDLAGVTVVTDKSVDAEGLTTMCVIFGSERARDFLEKNKIPAVLVTSDGSVITTGGVAFSEVK